MSNKITEKKWFAYALFPFCSLFWGFSFLGTTVALKDVEPIQLLALRWTVAAILVVVLAALKIIKINFKGKNIKLILLTGMFQPCIYSIFETLGIKYTTTSESSVFIATIPLMVLIIGELFLHKKTTLRTKFAILLAFVGVVISVALSPNFSVGEKSIGYLFLFIAIVTGAMYNHASSHASGQFNTAELTFGMAILASIFFNLLNFAMGYGFSGYRACFDDMNLMGSVLFLGICCSCLCYLIFNYVLAKLPTAIASNLTANTTTAVGVISGCLFAGDPFGWFTVVGVGLTITGVCISSMGNEG